MKTKSLQQRIRAEIDKIKVIDTHEHLIQPEEHKEVDLFGLICTGSPYITSALSLAGMTGEIEGWQSIRNYITAISGTGYFYSFLVSLKDLFGFKENRITDENWKKLSESIQEATKQKDWFRFVFKEKANIDRAIEVRVRVDMQIDRKFFLPSVRMDDFVCGQTGIKEMVGVTKLLPQEMEAEFGRCPSSLDEYLDLLNEAFERLVQGGACAVKSALAYPRSLHFESIPKSMVERIFLSNPADLQPGDSKVFQDFMMHELLKRCDEYNLPIQIHTGLAPDGTSLWNTNPIHLNNLFMEYPKVKFGILHGGYPFTSELAALAKISPNVYVDLCWLVQISPSAYEHYLHELIETVPASKILVGGGDCNRIEASYGSLLLSKEIVTRVLAK